MNLHLAEYGKGGLGNSVDRGLNEDVSAPEMGIIVFAVAIIQEWGHTANFLPIGRLSEVDLRRHQKTYGSSRICPGEG